MKTIQMNVFPDICWQHKKHWMTQNSNFISNRVRCAVTSSTTGSTGFGSGFFSPSSTNMMDVGMWACCDAETEALAHPEIRRGEGGSVCLEAAVTWWGVSEWTCCRRGSLISGQRSNTLVSWAEGSCRRTLYDWGFVLWQHFTNPSHTLGYFHTYKSKQRWREKAITVKVKYKNFCCQTRNVLNVVGHRPAWWWGGTGCSWRSLPGGDTWWATGWQYAWATWGGDSGPSAAASPPPKPPTCTRSSRQSTSWWLRRDTVRLSLSQTTSHDIISCNEPGNKQYNHTKTWNIIIGE